MPSNRFWIGAALLLALVVSYNYAAASHQLRHNEEYCEGLVTMAEQAGYAKAFGVTKDGFLLHVHNVGLTYQVRQEVVRLWLADAAIIFDAADGGEAHIAQCYLDAAKKNPVHI